MKNLSRNLRIALGILSLILGVAGLVLPILQGWLFLGIGLVLLSRDVPFFQKLSDRLEHRFPKLVRMRKAAKGKFTRGKKP
ncbi:MAG: PGPGW domain-containing protein [Desulfobacterales bacterium]|nr:PGPGW domain-containing protein [Desulfobacterales bacterium]